MAGYELWELRSGNLVGSFPTQEDALLVVAKTVSLYGPTSVDSLSLTWESGRASKDIAEGQALADLALKAFPDHKSTRSA